MKRWFITAAIILLVLTLAWLITTDDVRVWPVRNTIEYRLLNWWWQQTDFPQQGDPGVLHGVVADEQGRPIEGAWVLAARWDGKTYQDRSQTDGSYRIEGLPAGRYAPVAGAPGYKNVALASRWRRLKIRTGAETKVNVTLTPETPPVVSAGRNLQLGEATTLVCDSPLKSRAARQEVTFDNAGQPNGLTFLYTPVTATVASLPILLTIYPSPVLDWECASIPLANAGYAIVAIGPAHNLELEEDIDELERLRQLAEAGSFPGTNTEQIGLLGGSYSGLHIARMLERNPANVDVVILLGPPTDLFEMRYQLEQGNFVPPFGLDQLMIALGLPDREPMRYWRHSSAYHLQADFPPFLLIHSRTDEVIPYQQSELLVTYLVETGIPYELHLFEGASHYLLSKTGESLEIYEITLDFLNKHLE